MIHLRIPAHDVSACSTSNSKVEQGAPKRATVGNVSISDTIFTHNGQRVFSQKAGWSG